MATAAWLALTYWHEGAAPCPCPVTTPCSPHTSTFPMLQFYGDAPHALSLTLPCRPPRPGPCHLVRSARAPTLCRFDGGPAERRWRSTPACKGCDKNRIRARRSHRLCRPLQVHHWVRVDAHSRRSRRPHRATRRAVPPPTQPPGQRTVHQVHWRGRPRPTRGKHKLPAPAIH